MRIARACLLAVLLGCGAAFAQSPEGRALFLDPKKGNCLACHQVPGDPGLVGKSNIGPPLSALAARGQSLESLRALLADPARQKPNSNMPPYGRHRILSGAEIDAIARYVITL